MAGATFVSTTMTRAPTALFRLGLAVSVLGAVLLVAGCQGATSGSKGFRAAPPPADGKGLVYLYRPENIAVGAAPSVLINGVPALQMTTASYTWLQLPAGTHRFKVDWSREPGGYSDLDFDIEVVAGAVTAIKLTAALERTDMLHERFVLEAFRVPEVKAYREMAGCCAFVPGYRYGLEMPL